MLGHAAARLDAPPRPADTGPDQPDTSPLRMVSHSLVAHGDAPWAPQLAAEEESLEYLYDPFLTVRLGDASGVHLNVTDRVRRSWEPPGVDGPDALDVWFFGSGAMFGFGQRDDHTIASQVARLAAADGIIVRARNFGVPLSTGWQESLLFAQMLTEREPPALAVFYSGANDIAVSFCAPDGLGVSVLHARDIETALVAWGRLHTGARPRHDPDPGDPRHTAAVYGRGVALDRWLGAALGVATLHVLQAELNAGGPGDHDGVYELLGDTPPDPSWRKRYAAIADTLPAGVVDLRAILAGVDQPTFFDYTHTNELGARIVGERLYRELAPTLSGLLTAR